MTFFSEAATTINLLSEGNQAVEIQLGRKMGLTESGQATIYMSDKPCRLRRSTQHLLAVYLQESGSPNVFLGR